MLISTGASVGICAPHLCPCHDIAGCAHAAPYQNRLANVTVLFRDVRVTRRKGTGGTLPACTTPQHGQLDFQHCAHAALATCLCVVLWIIRSVCNKPFLQGNKTTGRAYLPLHVTSAAQINPLCCSCPHLCTSTFRLLPSGRVCVSCLAMLCDTSYTWCMPSLCAGEPNTLAKALRT